MENTNYKISNVYQSIKSLWKWFRVIYNDRDSDWVYILYIEREKLCNMYKITQEHGDIYGVGCSKYIKLCVELIDVIIETDGANIYEIQETYVNVSNSPLYKQMVKDGMSELSIGYNKDSIRMEKALRLYNRIRTEKLFGWWY